MGNHTDQLLPSGLAGRGEVLGEVCGHSAHPEVLGVHVQLLTVQLRQLGVGGLQVLQVLDGLPEGGEHLLAMGTDLGVPDDGRGAGQVPKVVKEPLCPGVDDQQPGLGSAFLHVDLAPEAGNDTQPLSLHSICSLSKPKGRFSDVRDARV
uniref:Uncharacterized protein n=1 Tax=Melopsittacus undulatus TaxID=13146 RepID=A0A8C6IRS4_MELUD